MNGYRLYLGQSIFLHLSFPLHLQPTPMTTLSLTLLSSYYFRFHPLAGFCPKSNDGQTLVTLYYEAFVDAMHH